MTQGQGEELLSKALTILDQAYFNMEPADQQEYSELKVKANIYLTERFSVTVTEGAVSWEEALNKGALKFNYKSFWHMLRYAANQDLPANIVEEIKKAIFEAAHLFMEANRQQRWIPVEERIPDLLKGQDYSENVFAIVGGELLIMTYCYIRDGDGYYAWCNCNGDVFGEGEFDDNYEVTHWQPLPEFKG